MKLILIAGAALAMTTSVAIANDDHSEMSRDDLIAACKGSLAEGSKTDCVCLTDKALEDKTALEQLLAGADADGNFPAEATAVIEACQKG